MAQRVSGVDTGAARVLVCNDARMHEVYWGCFELATGGLAVPAGLERVSKPEAVALPSDWSAPIHAAGRGFRAYPELGTSFGDRLAAVHSQLLPRAREIAILAAPVFEAGGAVNAE